MMLDFVPETSKDRTSQQFVWDCSMGCSVPRAKTRMCLTEISNLYVYFSFWLSFDLLEF